MDNKNDIKRIFFGPGHSIWQCLFADVYYSKKYEYCDFQNKCNSRFKEILISSRLQRWLPHFAKRIAYRYVLRYPFLRYSKETSIFFAFTNGYEMFGEERFIEFVSFLKKEFPNSKYGIHSYESMHYWSTEDVHKYMNQFDSFFTFNKLDAERFEIEYYGPICEKNQYDCNDTAEETDVFYSGSFPTFGGEDRLQNLLKIFEYLQSQGKKCEFFMYRIPQCGVDVICDFFKCKNIGLKGVINIGNSKFHINEYLPYCENLSWMKKTQVVLEYVHPEVKANCTCRLAQAMTYEKKLLTNSIREKEESYYKPENISFYSTASDIDLSFWNKPFKKIDVDFTGLKMLEELEKRAFDLR